MHDNLNILLMDVGPVDADALINELKNEGMAYCIKSAASKETFAEVISNYKPDLIIADYSLPEINGKILQNIASINNPEILFILVKRNLGEDIVIDLMRNGRNEFNAVEKPSNFVPAIKTAIKKASKKLQELNHNEDFFGIFNKLEEAFEGIAKINEKGLITVCNKTFLKLLDFSSDELTGIPFKNIIDRKDINEWTSAYEKMMSSSKAKTEIRLIKKNGSVIYGGIQILKNVRDDGKEQGYYCFTEDINERKQAEQSIREAQNFTAAILNSLTANIAILDSNGTILAVNRAWTAFALLNGGDPKNSGVGVNYLDICDKAIGKNCNQSRSFADDIRRVLNGEVSECEMKYPCDSFTEKRWFLAKVSKFIGEGSRKAVIVHTDITSSVLAEIELAKSEEKFRLLVQNSSDIMTIIDKNGNLKYISPSATKILGSLPGERENKNIFEYIHPDDIDNVKHTFEAGKKIINEPITVEFRYRKNDDSYIYLESIANNLLLDPEIEGVVINSREITDRKKAEEIIAASLKEKELLLREVHHRVKNNLQIVSSMLKLQEESITDESFRRVFRESINRIKAMSLIHQRLYQEQRLSTINFGEYLSSIVEYLKETFQANSKNINCKIISKNVDLNLETAIPCGLIINELVSNAFRHSYNGRSGGELLVKMESNGKNVITISDNGIGLPDDFDLQKCKTLGFKMVFNLLAQMGAEIEIFHENGTTFVITFENQVYTKRVNEYKI